VQEQVLARVLSPELVRVLAQARVLSLEPAWVRVLARVLARALEPPAACLLLRNGPGGLAALGFCRAVWPSPARRALGVPSH